MASIQKRPNGKWRARYRDNNGKEHARHFARKIDAQRWLDETTAALVTGKYVQPKAGKVTFRAFADEWLEDRIQAESTGILYRSHLERHVYPVIGDKQLDAIHTTTIRRLVKTMHDGVQDERAPLAPSTIETIYKITSTVFREAVRAKRIAETPCVGVRLPEVAKTRVRPLTTAQVETLTGTVPERLRALVILGAGTGLRQGELLGLTRDRIILDDDPRVIVDRQLITKPGGQTAFGPPKTKASERVVPLPRVVVDALKQHLEQYQIGARALLFTFDGHGITRQRFRRDWSPHAAAAGLTAETGVGVHALRHYYASLLIRYGESVKTVQSRLGHKSATETLDTYGHMWADSDSRTRAAIDTVLFASADSGRTEDANDRE